MTTYETQNLPEQFSLADYLDTIGKPTGDTITDVKHADWYCRKLSEIKTRLDDDEAQAEEQIILIQRWIEARREKAHRLISWLVQPLRNWLPGALLGKEKSVKLPHGTVGLRAQQPEFERDDTALLAWLDKSGLDELTVTKRAPNWQLVKKFITVTEDGKCVWTPTGEVLECVTATIREPKFYVKDNAGRAIEYTAPIEAPAPVDEIGAIVDPYRENTAV